MSLVKLPTQTLKIFLLTFAIGSTAVTYSVPNHQIQFENLPQEKRDDFYQYLLEAKRLFSQQRIFEAMDIIAKAETLIPEFPALMSIKGACYVEFRDFADAEKIFKRSLELSPNNHGIIFNLGEINFVQGKWSQSEKYFSKVVKMLKNKPSDSTYLLAEFKNYIISKKLKRSSFSKTIESKYDFTCDSPLYYYINAVKEMEAKNMKEGQLWLLRAKRVFKKAGQLDAWHDSMVESGYIKSFYGGGDRDETDLSQYKGNLNLAPISSE